jgi:hypothetical protein
MNKMKKIFVLLMAIIIVAGFVNLVGAENKKKTGTEKRRVVPLQTFVNSVAGKTDKEIKAIFGEPSCQGHYIFLGMLYENFVKDERTEEVFTAQILFKIGLPVGTIKMRDGRRVTGQSDFKFVASTIRCPYYTFEIEDLGDPVVTSYKIYVKSWRPTSLFPRNTQPIPTCETLKMENDRINQQIEQRDREKIEQEERTKKERALFESAIEDLIGRELINLDKFIRGGSDLPLIAKVENTSHGVKAWIHDYRSIEGEGLVGEEFASKGKKYILVPTRKRSSQSRGNLPWRKPSEHCPDCDVFEYYLLEDRNKDGTDYAIIELSIDSTKKTVSIEIYGSHRRVVDVEYADNSLIGLIASKLKARSPNSLEIDNLNERKGGVITETQTLRTKMKKTEQMPPTAEEKTGSPIQVKKIVAVTWTFATVRSGAGNDYPAVTSVNRGDKLIVIGESGEWLNVRLENNKQGWISNRVVK